jgi:hypothetical protein
MNEWLKEALDTAAPAQPDPRDDFFRRPRQNQSDPAASPGGPADSPLADDKREEQERSRQKQERNEALQPLG